MLPVKVAKAAMVAAILSNFGETHADCKSGENIAPETEKKA